MSDYAALLTTIDNKLDDIEENIDNIDHYGLESDVEFLYEAVDQLKYEMRNDDDSHIANYIDEFSDIVARIKQFNELVAHKEWKSHSNLKRFVKNIDKALQYVTKLAGNVLRLGRGSD